MTNPFSNPWADLAAPAPLGPAGQVGYRTGVIVTWDPLTLANTVRVDNTIIPNVQIKNLAEIPFLAVGSRVSVLSVRYPDGLSSFYIDGRIITPETDEATQVVSALSAGSILHDFIETTEGTAASPWVDLATIGPIVEPTVSPTGRLVVLLGAACSTPDDPLAFNTGGGLMSFALSGANTLAADDERAIQLVANLESVDGESNYVLGSVFGAIELTGLNAGLTTITAKYGADVAADTLFSNRSLTVITL
jgi:hypothetical protein